MLTWETAVLLLASGFAVGLLPAYLQRLFRRRTYRMLDQMLEEVLDGKKIGISDIREGELSALANKAVRIQEKLEFEIAQATNEKEQVKSLISNMSHQLKTPLSSVRMYRDILEGPLSDAQRREFLEKMDIQLEKLDWLLRSLFQMVRLEQGVIQFDVQETPIKETLLLAVNTVYEKAEKKQMQIVVEPFEDFCLLHNRKWTAEVFSNLLENAVKYSPSGSVITIQVCPMELVTQIVFRDCGMGIRSEELPLIFQRFYRSKEAEKVEGSGIGLYLSRLILEQENGSLTAVSAYGKGSSFRVVLQNVQTEHF